MRRVLILGASGLVGSALCEEMQDDYSIHGTYHKGTVNLPAGKTFCFDIADLNNLKNILNAVSPQLVISCLTGDFLKQLQLHRELARYLKDNQGKLYYCSTANVFDHDVTGPHYEDDSPDAESDYGKFKVQCENEIKDILVTDAVILRLPMIWGKNALRYNNLLTDLKENKEIEVYANLYKTSNTDKMLARQVHYIIDHSLTGTFHLATVDVMNYDYFISNLIKKLGYKTPKLIRKKLTPEKYYLALLSKRQDLPEDFRISNEDVLNFLAEQK